MRAGREKRHTDGNPAWTGWPAKGDWTAITTAVTGFFAAVLQWLGEVPEWARQAISMIDPFANKSPVVQNMVMGISTVASLAALLLMVRTIKDKTEARR